MVSPGARASQLGIPDGLFAPYELVREVGARPNPTYVVRLPLGGQGGKAQLAVAERFAGAAKRGDAAGEELTRVARRIATLASPNLPRVRDVTIHDDDLVVLGEFVEGEKLQSLWGSQKIPLEVALRVIVDVLAGVGALHNLRDAKQQPMKLAHGEVSPATVVLGLDGVARVLHAVSRCAPGARPEQASTSYLAPEVVAGEAYDARADVFGAGVLLWEALSGERLFAGEAETSASWRTRGASVPRAPVPEKAQWAKGLADVAAKALAFSPDDRWPTAAVLAAEVRKAAGLKLAPASAAAAFAKSAMGEIVKARRESLDGVAAPSTAPQQPPAASPKPPPAASPKPPPVASPKPATVAARPPSPAPAQPAPAAAPAAPPPPAPPSEPSSDTESVLVAPGIHAPVTEVVELESESLIEAAPSVPPPAAPEGGGGFLLDPFAASASLRQPLAPTPAVAFPPPAARPAPVAADVPVAVTVEEPAPPSVTGAPHFAAAIDLPPPSPVVQQPWSPAEPPSRGPMESSSQEADEQAFARAAADARRRKTIVLGGVGLLGLVVFVLAGVRFAARGSDSPPAMGATAAGTATTTATATSAPPPAATPAASAASPPAPTTPRAPAATTAAQPAITPPAAAPPPARAPQPAAAPPAAKPPPFAAAPARAAPAAAPAPAPRPAAAPRPRPKPTFDPNSL